MKRKLAKGQASERRLKEQYEDDSGSENEQERDENLSSEDDDSEGEEVAAVPSGFKKKGALSERDEVIMKERKAEQSRIENIVPYRNKQRVLVFCSRGVTSRFRHLMEDMRSMLPHHRKEVKLDVKKNLQDINYLCDLKACNNAMYFEARKSKDLYMWLSKTPNGPSVKFHLLNIHTMDELRLTGNCLKGSRPFLSFSKEFDLSPPLQLVKELFTQIYGTPNGHPKSKPFIDHVMTFSFLDGKIWFRHFQITDSTQDPAEIKKALKKGVETTKLVEIGPRFVLNIIKIFESSFGGRTLFDNEEYVTPNTVRRMEKRGKGATYKKRKMEEGKRGERLKVNILPEDPLRNVFK
uniref:Brix domain-containing protein n=1 Tax=Mucochytrium quahogii TaxID=96639 RepID=A0A7S2RF24_9STRA|mmetsp:Transcript_14357/g.23390  ORF Transcript_14357/g.23390 Transcript_14357/m.23390 type:complete len:351 (+) Transcript_14357:64-1116(+)|eukprot:CAMPEP_0203759826 /NCGR_PEP_ID=MMETSP0098-20131031/13057_1 /ASSEMBLY_ACC=CAM_ASM_000208 /TAXON_ID=96639 /ORGANISM=" , Strain NY0313808BC1" /LENGTH=350 /DNA_ID=CAMNT_0050653061 /DNA_START=104 /DNA_END=1156 /DNA_ORIENTATION=-